jgi:hypothetical protein
MNNRFVIQVIDLIESHLSKVYQIRSLIEVLKKLIRFILVLIILRKINIGETTV